MLSLSLTQIILEKLNHILFRLHSLINLLRTRYRIREMISICTFLSLFMHSVGCLLHVFTLVLPYFFSLLFSPRLVVLYAFWFDLSSVYRGVVCCIFCTWWFEFPCQKVGEVYTTCIFWLLCLFVNMLFAAWNCECCLHYILVA